MSFERRAKERYFGIATDIFILGSDSDQLHNTGRHGYTTLNGENYKLGFLHTKRMTRKFLSLAPVRAIVAPSWLRIVTLRRSILRMGSMYCVTTGYSSLNVTKLSSFFTRLAKELRRILREPCPSYTLEARSLKIESSCSIET